MSRARLRSSWSGTRQQTYLLEDGAFAAGSAGRSRRLGSVAGYARAISGLKPERATYPADVLGDDWRAVSRANELRFVLAELLPCLRDLAGGREEGVPAPLASWERRAMELRTALDERLDPEPYAPALLESLGVPCAVMARAVIPLAPVEDDSKPGLHVDIAGRTFRYCVERTEALPDFVRRTRLALRMHVREAVGADAGLQNRLKAHISGTRELLRSYEPVKRGSYRVFHHDGDHQLQYRGGLFMLVRGPLSVRLGGGTVYVGLPIIGSRRQERLAVAPIIRTSVRSFWVRPGVPARSSICMGTHAQYQRLLSKRFSEAEAVVQWLDAGAILATDRPRFHQMWREHGDEVPF